MKFRRSDGRPASFPLHVLPLLGFGMAFTRRGFLYLHVSFINELFMRIITGEVLQRGEERDKYSLKKDEKMELCEA